MSIHRVLEVDCFVGSRLPHCQEPPWSIGGLLLTWLTRLDEAINLILFVL